MEGGRGEADISMWVLIDLNPIFKLHVYQIKQKSIQSVKRMLNVRLPRCPSSSVSWSFFFRPVCRSVSRSVLLTLSFCSCPFFAVCVSFLTCSFVTRCV